MPYIYHGTGGIKYIKMAKEVDKVVFKECSNCGYLTTKTVIDYARFDYGCPECGESFAYFITSKRHNIFNRKSKTWSSE